jgi:RNA polymerase sigma-70 factor (ECF subfamily)
VTRSDAELLRAHLAGDRRAFHELVERYQTLLWRIAWHRLRCAEDAADAVQDTLLRAHEAAARCRADDSVGAWLVAILTNVCRDRYRLNRARPSEPTPNEVLSDIPEPRNEISELVDRLDVLDALDDLSPEQRTVLLLVDVAGYRVTEVAAMLGVPVGTVKSRGGRGRLRLQQRWHPVTPLQPATDGR